jgi:hypothetical protein
MFIVMTEALELLRAAGLAGFFAPTPEISALARQAHDLAEQVHRRARKQKVLRPDVTSADIVLLLEMVMLLDVPGPDVVAALRRRYLTLILQALHYPGSGPLPSPAANAADLTARWRTRRL